MPFTSSAFIRLCFWLLIFAIYGCSEKSAVPDQVIQYTPEVINPDYTGALIEPQTGAIFVWGSDGVIRRSMDGAAWDFIATGTTTTLNKIRGNSDTLIAVGEQGTVLHSANQGRAWQNISVDTAANLKSLDYSAKHQRWFAAGTEGTLLRSDDGVQWQKIVLGRGLDMLDIEAFFVSPETQRLLIGGSRGLYGFSDDGGDSWQVMQLDLDTPLSHFYHFNKILIATSAYGKILISRDDGDSWQLIETDGQAFFNSGVFDTEHNVFVLVSHNGKVLRTADNAATWQLIDAPFHGIANYLSSVTFDEHQKSLMAFGHYGTHLVSRDGGLSWASQPKLASTPFEDVVILPDAQTYLGFGRGGLLATSKNRGVQWQNHQAPLDVYWRIATVSSRGTWLLAGELGYMLRSTDQGKQWQLLDMPYTNPMTPPTFRAMIEEPQSTALIAAGPTGTIVRSTDDGATWKEVHYTAFDEGEAFTDLLIDAVHQHIIAVEADGRHYFSKDQGATWTPSRINTDRKFWHGSVLNYDERSVILLTGQAGVAALSRDGGESWQSINTNTHADLFGSFADPVRHQLFLAGAQGTLLRSQNDGNSWQNITLPTQSDLRRMTIDPKTNALLVFGGDGVILRSDNKGDTWQQIESSTTQELREATVEPGTRNLLVTGRDGKIIRSQDGGLTWAALPTHTASHFRSMTVDPNHGALIAVGERIVKLTSQK